MFKLVQFTLPLSMSLGTTFTLLPVHEKVVPHGLIHHSENISRLFVNPFKSFHVKTISVFRKELTLRERKISCLNSL